MKTLGLQQFDYGIQCQAYFLTLRFEHALSDNVIALLFDQLLRLFDESCFECDVLVIMPDHLHFIAHKKDSQSRERLYDLVRLLKSKSLYLLKKANVVVRTFWQHGYYEHVIRNERDWTEKARYVLDNPIKAGLVASHQDYPYLFVKGVNNGAAQGRPLRERG